MDSSSRLMTLSTRAHHPAPAAHTFKVTHQGQIAPKKKLVGISSTEFDRDPVEGKLNKPVQRRLCFRTALGCAFITAI
jgi:hypothetical protein